MNALIAAYAFVFPVGFLAGFFLACYLKKGTIMAITADFQAQIDRGNAALAALVAAEQAKIDAATATLTQDAADNLGGVTGLVDNLVAAAPAA